MFIKMIFFFVVAGWQLLLAKLLCVVFMPINSSSLWLRLAHTLAFARPTWLLDGIVIQWSLCDFSTTICSSVEVSGLYNHNCFLLWCLTTFSLCNTPTLFFQKFDSDPCCGANQLWGAIWRNSKMKLDVWI